MTALPLFDAVAGAGANGAAGDAVPAERLARFAEQLVASTLADLERVRDYERQFGLVPEGAAPDVEVLRSVWRLYAAWADDAEQVLARVRLLDARGVRVVDADRLDDATSRVRARLSVTAEQTAESIEDAGRGNVVSLTEMRDELHARLRR